MPGATSSPSALEAAREVLRRSRALVVTAGAGMGVDSGLPDFRGPEGFWSAYPAYRDLRLRFEDLANPRWFRTDPTLAWGFYGHRLELYRRTVPHRGFGILAAWLGRMEYGGFVFTSNVDGQFQRAGFDVTRILECHGSLMHLQCMAECGQAIFSAEGIQVTVDAHTFRARMPLPACPRCGGLARPNVLMFGDGGWDSTASDAQEDRLRAWLSTLPADVSITVVECGAGTSVPTVRLFGEQLVRARGGTLVRINAREPQVPEGHTSLQGGALSCLSSLGANLSD